MPGAQPAGPRASPLTARCILAQIARQSPNAFLQLDNPLLEIIPDGATEFPNSPRRFGEESPFLIECRFTVINDKGSAQYYR
jgi:hypothetical protein